jgi:hypothetical protein
MINDFRLKPIIEVKRGMYYLQQWTVLLEPLKKDGSNKERGGPVAKRLQSPIRFGR